jgi:hypothetical protein
MADGRRRLEHGRERASPTVVVRASATLAELVRAIERLVADHHRIDAIERFVAGWLRDHPHPSREVERLFRRSGLPQVSRGAGSLLGRIESHRRRDGGAPTAPPMREIPLHPRRDPRWFAHLRDTADAARWALRATGWTRLMADGLMAAAGRPLAPVRQRHPSRGEAYLRPTQAAEGWLDVSARAAPGVYAVQRAASGAIVAEQGPAPGEILARLGTGRRLPAWLVDQLEPELAALGRAVDVEHVLVHEGAEADALCRELGAHAFALGRHVVFRSGRFDPASAEGVALLAHELTHVWQQARGMVAASETLEADARRVGDLVAASPGAGVPARDTGAAPASEGVVQRSAGAPADEGPAAPRTTTRDALLAETRTLLEKKRLRPAAIFLVSDRVDALDAGLRARGTWKITAPVPLGPGFYFDGSVAIDTWSTLTPTEIDAIRQGRVDDLWVIGAQHPEPARVRAEAREHAVQDQTRQDQT